MIATLRALLSSDIDDLRTYVPHGDAFRITIRALIGPSNGPGEESFDFDVCSLAWLSEELECSELVSGRFCLFAAQFDYDGVERYVRNRIAQATGADWSEIANKLARWAHWEFEDYAERR